MIRAAKIPQIGKELQMLELSEVKTALSQTDGFVWVSLENASSTDIEQVLQSIFQFHPLSIDDCISTSYQTPKVDEFNDYLFIIAHAIQSNDGMDEITTRELDFFLGANYLVTCYQEAEMLPISATWKQLTRDERLHTNGPDFLCHAILDVLVDEYMPIIDQMDEELEQIEDHILAKPEQTTLQRLLTLKHSLLLLRRIINPQREVANRLSRDDFPLIDRQSRIYFRDIYDHLVRLQDFLESIRDTATGAMDIYLNSTSLRLNVIMKALTIVSTIFLPMSFVAGVYGMNFHYMPELTWKYGYFLIWGILISIPVGMLIFFKKHNWF